MPSADSSPSASLSSSFASLALSPTASGIGLPSPPPSDIASLELRSEDSDDEYIVLQRSQSSTGYDGPLAAGLAAAPKTGSGLVPRDTGTTASSDNTSSSEDERILDSWASVTDSINDIGCNDGRSKPLKWADESGDELWPSAAPGVERPLSTAGERTPVSGLEPMARPEAPVPLPSSRCKRRQQGGKGKKAKSSQLLKSTASVVGAAAFTTSISDPSSIAVSSLSPRSSPSDSSLYIPPLRNRSSFGSDTPSTFSVSAGSDRSHVSRVACSEGAFEDIVYEAIPGSNSDLSDICTNDSASAVLGLFFDESNPFGGAGPSGGGALGKLRFWQALVVELGILPAPDAPWSELSSAGDASSGDDDDAAASLSGTSDRTATEAEPFPTSLTAAKRLLKAEAHVNLVDYLRLRSRLEDARSDAERAEIRTQLKGLRKGSRSALKRYTLRSHKFAQRKLVKNAWLTPLMVNLI